VINRTDAVLGYLSEAVSRYVLGSDPFEIERLVGRMYREDFERAGAVVMTGIALIEMACWDLIGKSLNQPVYRLLGGAVRDKIKAYANGWYTVERTPAEFHAAAKRAVAKAIARSSLIRLGLAFTNWSKLKKRQPSHSSKQSVMQSDPTLKF
jgi:galactonate dehydratase